MPASAERRPRDADATRTRLLRAAMRRFTIAGYASTTVREIAQEADVNVALINRYFGSKEGLFEACLAEAAGELRRAADEAPPGRTGDAEASGEAGEEGAVDLADAITRQAMGTLLSGGPPHALLLLLRSSGEPQAEDLRLGLLRTFGERVAAAAQGRDGVDAADMLLRAQVVLATAVGIALLRSSGGLEPLASAGHEQLLGPVADLVAALLGNPAR